MKPRHFFLITIACGILLFVGCFYCVQETLWGKEFSRFPPVAVFQEVLGKPIPEGFSGLRAVGRHFLTKRGAWIRFKATDTAIQTFLCSLYSVKPKELSGYEVGPIEKSKALPGNLWVASSRYTALDLKTVGWPSSANPQDFDVYMFSRPFNENKWQWSGYILVDRKKNIVYIHAGGD
jgi:hypothetical protein